VWVGGWAYGESLYLLFSVDLPLKLPSPKQIQLKIIIAVLSQRSSLYTSQLIPMKTSLIVSHLVMKQILYIL